MMKFPWDKKQSSNKEHTTLFVGPHPDDIELGCAGLISAGQKAGKSIKCLIMTKGEFGGAPDLRVGESTKALNALGVSQIIYGPFIDTELAVTKESIQWVEKYLEGISAAFIPTVHDTHQDHRHCYQICMAAMRGIGSIFCYQTASATVQFSPRVFADITNDFADKCLALSMHKSQSIRQRSYMEYEAIKASAAFRGLQIGVPYAEGFEIERGVLCV